MPPLVFRPQLARVSSAYIRKLTEEKLLIPGRNISLMDTVGQGKVTPIPLRFKREYLPLPPKTGGGGREGVREKASPVLSHLVQS